MENQQRTSLPVPEPGDVSRERLVARRAAAVAILLTADAEFRAASGIGHELWGRFDNALRTLAAVHRESLARGESVSTLLPDGSFSVQIAPLAANEGFVLMLEPFAQRDAMRDVYERYRLTPRERDVARLLVAGANTGEIAAALSIAPSTAVIHVKSILSKTRAKTRAAAVSRMVQLDDGGSI